MAGFVPGLGDPVSRVRLAVGDTREPFDLADETIQALVDLANENDSPNPVLDAAVSAARALAARFLKLAQSERVGDQSVSYGDRAESYRRLAATLATDGLPDDPGPPPSPLVGSRFPVVALPGSNLEDGAHPFA